MRLATLFLFACFAASAQDAGPDRATVQVLLEEVRLLRAAIERSSLLGARVQIAVQRLQVQEMRTVRVSQEQERLRRTLFEKQADQARGAAVLKNMEEELSRATGARRQELEATTAQVKVQMEPVANEIRETQAKEAETGVQAQTEQRRLADMQARIDELERALDAAIQQSSPRP